MTVLPKKILPEGLYPNVLPFIRSGIQGRSLETNELVLTTTLEKRASLATSIFIACGMIAAVIHNSSNYAPRTSAVGTSMNLLDLGMDQPLGDPNGNTGPTMPIDDPAAGPAPEAQNGDEPSLPDETKPEPILVEDMAAEPDPIPPAPADTADANQGEGSGSVALGARVNNDGGALDGDLASAVGAAIATQIKACWDAPFISTNEALTITMSLVFSETGELATAPVIARHINDTPTIVTDYNPFETAAITAAVRCSPIRLPANLYSYWRQVDIEIFSSQPITEN